MELVDTTNAPAHPVHHTCLWEFWYIFETQFGNLVSQPDLKQATSRYAIQMYPKA